jgi:hypothetical protein
MNLRPLGGALLGASVLLLLVLQVLPWAHVKVEPTTVPGFGAYGFSSPSYTVGGGTGTATTWNLQWSSDNGANHDEGWYSSDLTDGGGDHTDVYLIRAAIPILLAGTALGLAAALATFLSRGALGPVLGLAAALLLTVGTILFANGADELFEGSPYIWLAGFYVAIAACALALAGGVVGLAGRAAEPARTGTTA